MKRLIEFGALGPDAAQLLQALVVCKRNIIVSGGTGSGKTSLLNALSSFIPEGERTIVIEDARELQLQREHVVFLEARPPDAHGKGAVSIRDLFKATLRMRPDRIVVGEIRSGEALDLIQAMTSGHGGCLSTVHATYPRDALSRLETLALMSDVDLPLTALRAQLASAVDIIVQTVRLRDGSRRITHISELCSSDPERGYTIADLFTGRQVGQSRFELVATGQRPRCEDTIRLMGFSLPPEMLQSSAQVGGAS
jgi:pilus assembly protein CpaF